MGVVGWCMASLVFIMDMGSKLRQLRFTHPCGHATYISNFCWEQLGLADADDKASRRLVGWISVHQILLVKKKTEKMTNKGFSIDSRISIFITETGQF